MKTKTIKVNYSTIEAGKKMPVAYSLNGKIKTVFRTVKADSTITGFYVLLNGEKQAIAKTDKPLKGVSTYVIFGANAIGKPAPTAPKAETKEPNKAPKAKKPAEPKAKAEPKTKAPRKAKKAAEPVYVSPILYNGHIPANIVRLFPDTVPTLQTIIANHVKNANARNMGIKLENEKIAFNDGMNALAKITNESIPSIDEKGNDIEITPFMQLQGTIVAYFLKGIATYTINKFLEFGSGYKQLEKRDADTIQSEESYMNASSNNGKIIAYDNDDLFNSLVVQAYTKTFDEKMFDSMPNVHTTMYYRISNLTKTEMRRLKFQTKVSIDDATKFIPATEGIYSKQSLESNIQLVNELSFLTAEEKELLELRIKGYQKKEVYDMKGRVDRKFKSLESKLEQKAGKTLKQAKAEGEQERETLSAKLKAMKEAKKAEKEMKKAL
jgi:hypothetical protein